MSWTHKNSRRGTGFGPIALGLSGLALAVLSACGDGSDRRSAGPSAPAPYALFAPAGGEGGACGVPGIEAVTRPPVEGPGDCGVPRPVVVSAVSGVALRNPAIMNCRSARALDTWVRTRAVPAVGNRGGGLAELQVAAHYACRTRNSRPGARISEHATGSAIDISSIAFRDGTRVGVLNGWRGKPEDAALLRKLHRGACGPFGTVLGPEADRHHQDHLHFDVAAHRKGSYCR